MCEKLFTLTITEKEAILMLKAVIHSIGATELAKNIPKEDYLLLVGLLTDKVEVSIMDALEKGLEHFHLNKHKLHEQSGFILTD